MSKKCNKKVIRKPNIDGSFTTIHHSILFDKRLTPTAHWILTVILSDSDTKFSVSQKALAKRLEISLGAVKKALENLEDCGYLKREKQPRGHFYFISEFGNLNKEKDTPKVKDVDLEVKITKNNNLLNEYLITNSDYIDIKEVHETIIDLVVEFTNDNLLDFYPFRVEANKIITKWKKDIFFAFMDVTNNASKNVSKATIKEYSDWLKGEIFENNRMPEDEYKSKWMALKLKNKTYKTDFETAAYDKAEEEYYDNQ